MTSEQKLRTSSNAERVAKSRERLLKQGGRRLPTGYLQPDAAAALDALIDAGYSTSITGVISAALLDAQRKIARR